MFLHKIFIDLRRRDMVSMNASICPKCGGELKHYDSVQRIIRTKARSTVNLSLGWKMKVFLYYVDNVL